VRALGRPKVLLGVRGDNLDLLDFYARQGVEPEDVRVLGKGLGPPAASPRGAGSAAR
jgi:hypothetical protein